MKLCAGFLLALLVIKMANSEDVKLVARAICGIIEETFVKKSERFEIISVTVGRQKNMDVLDEVLRLYYKANSFPIEIRYIDLTLTWDRQLKKSAIFLLESPEAFVVIDRMEFDNEFPNSFKFLLYNDQLAADLIEQLKAKNLSLSWEFAKFSFLRHRNGFVELNAITSFTPETCGTYSAVIINKFSENSQMWETKEFFITKIDQFHGCELKVYLGENAKSNFGKTLPNGTKHLTGPLHAFLTILSKHLNFTYRFARYSSYDIMYETCSLNDIKYIINFGNETERFHITTTFMSVKMIVVTTLGEYYTPLEKLFMPFDKETYILIGLVLVGALILIIATKHAPVRFRNFMFGRRVRTPTLSLWIGIVTGAQMFRPRRNWSRIALAVFLLMVFVMQNVYQNKMFDFLVGDGRKPPPQSLEDLVARNYTLHLHEMRDYMIKELEPSKRPRMLFHKETKEVSKVIVEKLKDPNFKGAFLTTSDDFSDYLGKTSRENVKLQRMDENILTGHLGLLMDANAYFFDTLDQGIKKLLPTGLIGKGNIAMDPPNRKPPKEEDTEKALSMKEMGIAFKILIFGHAIALVVFVLEQLKFHLFDRKREIKKLKPKLERRNAIRREIKEAEIVVDDETKKKLKSKLERRNAIRRKIKEAGIVVDETQKKKEAVILEEDLVKLVVVEETIHEHNVNLARCN